MSDWNAISAFMASVVPWPVSPQDAGYVNLHFSTVDRKNPTGPLRKGGGWPFRSVDSFVQRASWINTTTQFKDVWYCLSLQSQTKPNAKDPAKPRAHRLAANALKVKAIWADVDVGEKPGEYATIELALKAVIEFRERHGLPPFSAIVGSGGGIQIYWIARTEMTVREWAPYADGLRALMIQDKLVKDPGVTCDVARILRVPGTFNHKYTPPKPVQLLNLPLALYDFETDLAMLPPLAPAISATVPDAPKPVDIYVDGSAAFAAGPAFTIDDGSTLQGGIDKHEDNKLDPQPIFKQCGFFQEALLTGGAGYDNALWMYSVLGATFMENGNEIAHAISKGHASYSKNDTQALYDRKVVERADRGIGYPSCATIAGAGCQACQTCPLFAKGKSPLNIRPVVTAAVSTLNMTVPGTQTQGAQDMFLPMGYDLDGSGIICEVVQNEVNGELMEPTLYPLFMSKLSNPWAQNSPDSLNFTTTVDLGRTFDASIRHTDMSAMKLGDALNQNHVKIFPRNKARLEHFMVSWLAKLHEISAAADALPFGWYRENGNITGFVYGGRLWKDDGSDVSCGVGDANTRKIFHPTGDIQHWYDAAKCITMQKRPEMDAIIALAFSAPLTALVGYNAVTLSAYGDSGAGKSAAFAVGVGVWGHSKKGKQVTDSTFNHIMGQLGQLANLPLYWDEIKNAKAQQTVYNFLFNSSDGVEKGRMKADTSLQDKGTWQTQIMIAANISMVDFAIEQDTRHVAHLSRLLEYEFRKSPNPVGQISKTEASKTIDKLQTSYGMMGKRYSQLLALNHVAIAQECMDACKRVEVDMQVQDEERMWVALVGTMLVGARLANELGADLDLPALKDFLYRVYLDNRAKRDSMTSHQMSVKETVESVLSGYFSKIDANDQAIWTRGMPLVSVGRPAPVDIIKSPRDQKNVSVMEQLAVRWDVQGRTCYILKDSLFAYLRENKHPVGTTIATLMADYKMVLMKKIRLGAGAWASGRQTVYAIPHIDGDHDLAELMYKWVPADERPAPSAPPSEPEAMETGITEAFTGLASPASVVAIVEAAKNV